MQETFKKESEDKMKKRIFSMLLIAVMLMSALASCTQIPQTLETPITSAPTSATPTPTDIFGKYGLSEAPEHLKNLDFNGEEIGIIMSGGDKATRSIVACECDCDYDNVYIRIRNGAVEELLNVKFDYKGTVGMQGMISHMREYIASPDTSYDIVGVYRYFDLGIAYDGDCMYALNKIEEKDMYLRPEADYWDTDAYDVLALEGESYWITGDLSRSWLSSIFVSYVNKELWKNYENEIAAITGVEGDIYDLVYSGKWTIDLWCELNELVYVNNDGDETKVTPEDQHGFIGNSAASNINNFIVDGLFSGCHVTFSKKDASGALVMDYNNKYLKDYSAATNKLFNESKSCTIPYNGDKTAWDVFADGNSLMTINTLSIVESGDTTLKSGYYILPPPKANKSQADYATTVGDSVNMFGIPTKTENLAAATATLEALGFYSRDIITEEVYSRCLGTRYVNDGSDKASEMLDFILSKIYTDFLLANTGNFYESVSWYLRKNIGNTLVTSEAAIKEVAWGKYLNSLFEPIGDVGDLD